MAAPVLKVEYTTDDPDDVTPTWVDVTSSVRAFSTNRGRDNELARVEAGTARLVLDNRDRAFDPTADASLRPMNRWRISAILDSGTEEIFVGYAESYEQQWPATGKDAVTVVACVDEFKVLALDHLPNFDPPRDTYRDVVMYDNPSGYWRFQESGSPTYPGNAEVGPTPLGSGSWSLQPTPIVGDYPPAVSGSRYGAIATTEYLATISQQTGATLLDADSPLNAAGLSQFTFETWFKSSEATPAADRRIATGPLSGGNPQWFIELTTLGTVAFYARNSGGTLVGGAIASAISANTWYHIAVVLNGTNTLIYKNGVVSVNTGSWSGVIGTMDAGGFFQLGTSTAVGGTRYFDEPAFYREALSASRILAHYNAGALRGYAAQDPGVRIEAVLDDSVSVAGRDVDTGTREMTPTFMAGRAPLELLRDAERADAVDAVLFIAKDGTITFLADGHRSASPYNTVQATFDDDGTDLPYQDLQIDYSESFLANEWNVTRQDGTTTTASDATSISAYLKRSQSLTDLPITTASDQSAIATAMLAKYKNPLTRITGLSLLATEAVAEAILPLDIGHRIRVFRTQPTGGRIDQTLFIQRIAVDGDPSAPWRIQLGVSPL